MPKLNLGQIQRVALGAGFGTASRDAALVALAESGGDPEIFNGSCCTGLWQIHSQHMSQAEAKDPKRNAMMAVKIWKGAGKTWRDWQVVTDCGGPTITPEIRKCLTEKAKKHGGDLAGDAGAPADAPAAGGDKGKAGVFGLVEAFFKWLTSKDTWLNLGKIGIGITAFLYGLKYAIGIDATPGRMVKGAANVAL